MFMFAIQLVHNTSQPLHQHLGQNLQLYIEQSDGPKFYYNISFFWSFLSKAIVP